MLFTYCELRYNLDFVVELFTDYCNFWINRQIDKEWQVSGYGIAIA